MSENTEEVLETTEQTTEENKPMSYDDGIIKVNLDELNKPQENAIQEQSADASDDTVGQPEDTPSSEEVVEEVREPSQEELQPVQNEETVLEEITEEEVAEKTEELEEQVEQAIVEQEAGIELPENIQKVVEFMNDTGGSLEDYVKLNTDYSKLNEAQLIREFYETTKPHLDKEDIELLMEDFSYDEELDEPKDVRKAKIAFKEEAAKAKKHLEKLKSNYYEEIKAGSKLNPEQQKAVEFLIAIKKTMKSQLK